MNPKAARKQAKRLGKTPPKLIIPPAKPRIKRFKATLYCHKTHMDVYEVISAESLEQATEMAWGMDAKVMAEKQKIYTGQRNFISIDELTA